MDTTLFLDGPSCQQKNSFGHKDGNDDIANAGERGVPPYEEVAIYNSGSGYGCPPTGLPPFGFIGKPIQGGVVQIYICLWVDPSF